MCQTLKADIVRRINLSETKARSNYQLAYFLIFIGSLTSIAAAIFVAAGVFTPYINALLASVPGIVVTILNTFKFEARSNWWWKKNFYLIGLMAEFEKEAPDEAKVRKELSQFLIKHQKNWPGFGFDRPPMGLYKE